MSKISPLSPTGGECVMIDRFIIKTKRTNEQPVQNQAAENKNYDGGETSGQQTKLRDMQLKRERYE